MSFWDDVLALSPACLWKLDDSIGSAQAADATGNGRPGDYSATGGGQALEEPSIIPNEADSTCAHNHSSTTFITRNNEAWMNPGDTFTAMFTVSPDSFASRDIFGKVNSWQVWLGTDGRITAQITPAWTALTSSNDAAGKLVVGQGDLIVVRQDAAANELSLWLRGVKVASVAKNSTLANSADQLRAFGSSTNGSRKFIGHGQGFAYWPGVALTDVQIQDLHTTWASVPPDAPVISVPAPADNPNRLGNFYKKYRDNVPIEFNDVAGATEYRIVWNATGGASGVVLDWAVYPSPFLWTNVWTALGLAVGEFIDVSITVKARDAGGLESVASDPASFTVERPDATLPVPTVDPVWERDRSVMVSTSKILLDAGANLATPRADFQFDAVGGDFLDADGHAWKNVYDEDYFRWHYDVDDVTQSHRSLLTVIEHLTPGQSIDVRARVHPFFGVEEERIGDWGAAVTVTSKAELGSALRKAIFASAPDLFWRFRDTDWGTESTLNNDSGNPHAPPYHVINEVGSLDANESWLGLRDGGAGSTVPWSEYLESDIPNEAGVFSEWDTAFDDPLTPVGSIPDITAATFSYLAAWKIANGATGLEPIAYMHWPENGGGASRYAWKLSLTLAGTYLLELYNDVGDTVVASVESAAYNDGLLHLLEWGYDGTDVFLRVDGANEATAAIAWTLPAGPESGYMAVESVIDLRGSNFAGIDEFAYFPSPADLTRHQAHWTAWGTAAPAAPAAAGSFSVTKSMGGLDYRAQLSVDAPTAGMYYRWQIRLNGVADWDNPGQDFIALGSDVLIDAIDKDQYHDARFAIFDPDTELQGTWSAVDTFGVQHLAPDPLGAITSPLEDAVVTGNYPITVPATTHPEGEAIEYRWEHNLAGAGWVLLRDWAANHDDIWATAALPYSEGNLVRVKARSAVSQVETDWVVSDEFVIYHGTTVLPPAAPDYENPWGQLEMVSIVSIFGWVRGAIDGHASTRWEIYAEGADPDVDPPIFTDTSSGTAKMGQWMIQLATDTDFLYRYARVDWNGLGSGVDALWSPLLSFRTLRLSGSGSGIITAHIAKDEKGILNGRWASHVGQKTYGDSPGEGAEFWRHVPAIRESYDRGTKSKFAPATERRVCRFDGAAVDGTDHRKSVTAMLLFAPFHIPQPDETFNGGMELMGWDYMPPDPDDYPSGRVGVAVKFDGAVGLRMTCAYGTGINDQFTHNSDNIIPNAGVAVDELSCVFLARADSWFEFEAASPCAVTVPLAPEDEVKATDVWVCANGIWVHQTVTGAEKRETTGDQCLIDILKYPPLPGFNIGHFSTNREAGTDTFVDGRYLNATLFGFCIWDSVLTQAQMLELDDAARVQMDLPGFLAALPVGFPEPVIYNRFRDYPRPNKPSAALTVL